MNKYSYTIKWSQPYSLDYSLQTMYNKQEQLVERLLEDNQMLDAKQIIDRIRQL